jgi:hypothetical protein
MVILEGEFKPIPLEHLQCGHYTPAWKVLLMPVLNPENKSKMTNHLLFGYNIHFISCFKGKSLDLYAYCSQEQVWPESTGLVGVTTT